MIPAGYHANREILNHNHHLNRYFLRALNDDIGPDATSNETKMRNTMNPFIMFNNSTYNFCRDHGGGRDRWS
jgi:hypothetical protein